MAISNVVVTINFQVFNCDYTINCDFFYSNKNYNVLQVFCKKYQFIDCMVHECHVDDAITTMYMCIHVHHVCAYNVHNDTVMHAYTLIIYTIYTVYSILCTLCTHCANYY